MPEVIFTGPAGRLEGRYHPAKQKNAPIAMILHPHPQFHGTMNHQIVYQCYYAFAHRGFSVLRFNFRGVGRSQGSFDHGTGELSDAASALDWAQTINPEARACWVAGFSFGAWIGMQLLMRRPEVEGFISIAPPANLYDFSFLAPCPSSGLIVHGENDPRVPVGEAKQIVDRVRENGGMVEYLLYEDNGQPVPLSYASSFPSAEQLFDAIQDGIDRRADEIEVDYDATYGYPTNVYIDYDRNRTGEELSLTTHGMQPWN